MKRIIITGIRGGSGSTTIAANLIQALELNEENVHVIDARSENLMRFHFAMDLSVQDGWAKRWLNGESWKNAAYMTPNSLSFIPYGGLTLEERLAFQQKLLSSQQNYVQQIKLGSNFGLKERVVSIYLYFRIKLKVD